MAYSHVEVAEAIIRLAVNHYDFDKTSEELGVSVSTLKRWAKNEPKKGTLELLERAAQRMLMVIPTEWKGHDWAVTIGILIDKIQLMQGKPTERTESIIQGLRELSDDERETVLEEARELIRELGRTSAGRESDRQD